MKFKKLAISLLAVIASTSAIAGFHGYSDRASEAASPNVAVMQEVLDRNFNPYYAKTDHFNRIRFSGMILAMAGLSTHDPSGQRFGVKGTVTDIWVPRVNLNIDAMINEWVVTHVTLSLGENRFQVLQSGILARDDARSFRRFGLLDEAVVTIGNIDQNPAYFRAGIGRVPFGYYRRNTIPASFVQLLTETQTQYVQIGFMDASGFNGSAFAFRSAQKVAGNKPVVNNGGVQVGYVWTEDRWMVDATVDWMYNAAGAVNALNPAGVAPVPITVGAVHAGLKGSYDDFDGRVFYVTSLQENIVLPQRLSALLVELGYSFPLAGMDSRLAVSYHHSFNADQLALAGAPINVGGGATLAQNAIAENRVQGDFTMTILKNVDAGLHVIWNRPYKAAGAGRPTSTVTGLLSLNARIA